MILLASGGTAETSIANVTSAPRLRRRLVFASRISRIPALRVYMDILAASAPISAISPVNLGCLRARNPVKGGGYRPPDRRKLRDFP